MNATYQWVLFDSSLSEIGLEEFLDSCKSKHTEVSHLVRCQLCPMNLNCHQMRYQILVSLYMILTCQETIKSDVHRLGRHHTEIASPKKPKLTLGMKRKAVQLDGQHSKPNRIRHDILDRFETESAAKPTLSQRTKLKETEFVEDMVSLAARFKFHSDIADGDPFFFGFGVRENGAPVFGIGSDDDPLVVGVSTPFIIKALCFAEEYVFHIDVTHKLNQTSYPTTVVGVSDSYRSFHPVAMCFTSQVTGPVMTVALSHLFDTYKELTGEFPTIGYCMVDADKAQFNAVAAVNALKTETPQSMVYLMCFFHVIKNVGEHIRGKLFYTAIKKWKAVPELVTFAEYFKKQWVLEGTKWLDTTFSNWSVFHKPPGYATTNNLVETFNKIKKQDYTFCSLVKLVGLMDRLKLMCRHWSSDVRPFSQITVPNRELLGLENNLRETRCLWSVQPHRSSILFLLGEDSDGATYVCQREEEVSQIDANLRWMKLAPILKKMYTNRMEVADQPVQG
ncbi:hypothetical protein PHPALM_29407 [Phytophthora palmivora]|uniref:Uncharacterized protein n=1 Tax=Phytophthora palmivora TaxID=4796 RepID=A0A2P4X7N1_9STRA|nr:hypothetical protein PHPALM_29407 [Phytophthora palmivora]